MSGDEQADACAKACYDCLLSFYNQFEHPLLDRNLAIPFLKQLLEGDVALDLTGSAETWERLKESAASNAERQVLEQLQKRNCPPPTRQHDIIKSTEGIPVAEADLTYPGKILVLVDGDPHKWEHIKNHDAGQRQKLKALGYEVVVIDMEDPEPGYQNLMERLGVSVPEVVGKARLARRPSETQAVAPPPRPSVEVRSKEEIDPYNGWVPFYTLAEGRPGTLGAELGWVLCDDVRGGVVCGPGPGQVVVSSGRSLWSGADPAARFGTS